MPIRETLSTLVAMPTVSHRPTTEIAAYIARRAEDCGFKSTILKTNDKKANVIATKGPIGTDGLVISGHMDVVPTDGQNWSSDPFTVTERDGRLFGRGTADMKGFIAAVLDGCDAIGDLSRELTLIFTHDEEVGCAGSDHLVKTWDGHQLPTQAWIGEPTSMAVCRMHAGHTTLRLDLMGEPAHSSRPNLGKNAITALEPILKALRDVQREIESERAFESLLENPFTVVCPALLRGGSAINIVPERVTMDIGIRCLPGVDSAATVGRIVERLMNARFGGVVLQHTVVQDAAAMLTPADTPLAGLLGASGEAAVPFATDGGNLARLGTAPLVCGPGSIDVAHRPDEYVDLRALVDAQALIERVIANRCG